jgi:hypothetical protein
MKKISFQKFEHMILPRFRQKINDAESIEDIKKAFTSSVVDLLEKAFEGLVAVSFEDVEFRPFQRPYFYISRELLEADSIRPIWKESDIRNIIARLAESTMNHYKHYEKHQEKTNASIRMNVSI